MFLNCIRLILVLLRFFGTFKPNTIITIDRSSMGHRTRENVEGYTLGEGVTRCNITCRVETPASVYHNEINFNKNRKYLKIGQKLCQQNGH